MINKEEMRGEVMNNKIKEEQQTVYNLFFGASFTGFAFDSCFTLKFNRETTIDIDGIKFRGDFKIIISSELCIEDNKKAPKRTVQDGMSFSDKQSEPVLSYMLADLRWSDGADIYDVKFEDKGIKLLFRNGTKMYISNHDEDDYAWMICEAYTTFQDRSWDIICENNNIYISRK